MAVEKVSNKSRLSRDLIKTTMKRLVAETNANSVITVTTLVREANINRATFYYHYESLEQVYLDILNDFIENAEQLVKSYGKNLTGAILAHSIVEWLEENEAFCRSFIRRYPLFAYSDVRKVLGNWAFRMSCHLFGYDVEPPPSVLLFVSGLIVTVIDDLASSSDEEIDFLALEGKIAYGFERLWLRMKQKPSRKG